MIEMLTQQVMRLREAGKFDQAVPLAQRLCKLYEEQFGAEDPQTLAMENNLAVLLEEGGLLEQAETQYRSSLQKRLEVLGDRKSVV